MLHSLPDFTQGAEISSVTCVWKRAEKRVTCWSSRPEETYTPPPAERARPAQHPHSREARGSLGCQLQIRQVKKTIHVTSGLPHMHSYFELGRPRRDGLFVQNK